MYSIMNGINVEVYNNGKKVRDNYAVSEDDPDYEKDYEIPDVILDVFDEFTLLRALMNLSMLKYTISLMMESTSYFNIN